MIVVSFLADFLEMLQIGISMEGGHVLHGGHFGFNYSNNREQREMNESNPQIMKGTANHLSKKYNSPLHILVDFSNKYIQFQEFHFNITQIPILV